MKKKQKRFRVVYTQGGWLGFAGFSGGCVKIVVDQITGVHYLVGDGLTVGGITPLLDDQGKPIVENLKKKSNHL
ncbi:MAG: hypothetical protein IJP92_02975 [Lachnospiraceae bacterium]|nr:hypothetical protein [Lachnospiraceae bacterium]